MGQLRIFLNSLRDDDPIPYAALEYVKSLPFQDAPEAFGMHANANITCAMKETDSLLGTALSLQPRDTGGGGGKSWADIVKDVAADVEKSLPPQFDYEKCLID